MPPRHFQLPTLPARLLFRLLALLQKAQNEYGIIQHGASRKEFDHLVLIADPRTLGKLRKNLRSSLKRVVHKESNLDLTHLTDLELAARVSDLLA